MRCEEMGKLKTGTYTAIEEESGMEITVIREEGDGWIVSAPAPDGNGLLNVVFAEDGSIEALIHVSEIDE